MCTYIHIYIYIEREREIIVAVLASHSYRSYGGVCVVCNQGNRRNYKQGVAGRQFEFVELPLVQICHPGFFVLCRQTSVDACFRHRPQTRTAQIVMAIAVQGGP